LAYQERIISTRICNFDVLDSRGAMTRGFFWLGLENWLDGASLFARGAEMSDRDQPLAADLIGLLVLN
jgi:hypothetical protein